ncbi:Glycosyltransferase family 25 (LPS biosynthesis protein) [Gammaproteobacteria bacterium MOLA455]|nr:Glycosyltransferase family 25 (LPS biosynthesis protein) [Gammaproteobacteria bacterium MOLA455]
MATPLTFVINLDKSQERLSRISARLGELEMPFERVAAIYGADLNERQLKSVYSESLNAKSYRRPLSRAEVGCYMSHLKAWQTIVDRELACALIIEDDLVIDAELKGFIESLSHSTGSWDIVKFYCRKKNPKIISRTAIDSRHDLCRFKKIPIGNLAQLITLDGAKKLLAARQPFGRPADDDIQHWWEADLNVLGVFPPVVHVIPNAKSDIEQQGLRKEKRKSFRPWHGAFLRAKYEYRLRTTLQKTPLPILVGEPKP